MNDERMILFTYYGMDTLSDGKSYTRNGVLGMLKRNASIKNAPEKFQKDFVFADIIITFEDRVFNTTVEGSIQFNVSSCVCHSHRLVLSLCLSFRNPPLIAELQYRAISSRTIINHRPCHVINMNIIDNHREAERGAKMCMELVREIERSEDWENDIRSILYTFERKYKRHHVFHVVLFI